MTTYSQGFHNKIKRIRRYSKWHDEYKVQAVKLAKEIGGAKASRELGIPEGTIHTWLKAVRAGNKEIRRLKEENEFLDEASAFFAAGRWKSVKTRE